MILCIGHIKAHSDTWSQSAANKQCVVKFLIIRNAKSSVKVYRVPATFNGPLVRTTMRVGLLFLASETTSK